MVWSLTASIWGDLWLWHHPLNGCARSFLLHIYSRKRVKRDLSTICEQTLTNAAERKVPPGSPFYHDYTRIDGVSGPAEIQPDWIWAEESSGNGFHPLTFSNKREELWCIHNSDSHLQQQSTTRCCDVCLLNVLTSFSGSEGLLLNRAEWGRGWVDWDPVNGGWGWNRWRLARLSVIIKKICQVCFLMETTSQSVCEHLSMNETAHAITNPGRLSFKEARTAWDVLCCSHYVCLNKSEPGNIMEWLRLVPHHRLGRAMQFFWSILRKLGSCLWSHFRFNHTWSTWTTSHGIYRKVNVMRL